AQKAARQAAGGRPRPARGGPRRDAGTGRGDRPERGGRRRADAAAEGTAPEAATVEQNAGA
ncbi:MAG: 30S ribosomal protein S3, partial [Propionicimonas sp.]